MYEEHVLDHYRDPYHKGPTPDKCGWIYHGDEKSIVCGDHIHIETCFRPDHTFNTIWWEGEGCCFSMAAASMLIKHAENKTIQEMLDFTDDDMLEMFRAKLPKMREDCVLVALKAFRKILENYTHELVE